MTDSAKSQPGSASTTDSESTLCDIVRTPPQTSANLTVERYKDQDLHAEDEFLKKKLQFVKEELAYKRGMVVNQLLRLTEQDAKITLVEPLKNFAMGDLYGAIKFLYKAGVKADMVMQVMEVLSARVQNSNK